MTKREKELLDATIVNWEAIRDNPELFRDHECVLCDEYLEQETKVFCQGCPVVKKTEAPVCIDTPFSLYNRYWDKTKHKEKSKKLKHLAQEEIDFLKTCYY